MHSTIHMETALIPFHSHRFIVPAFTSGTHIKGIFLRLGTSCSDLREHIDELSVLCLLSFSVVSPAAEERILFNIDKQMVEYLKLDSQQNAVIFLRPSSGPLSLYIFNILNI
uniref:Uncharacterized protein n=1 Tax=Glossina austeni TaxID=7395 RepID=A0A1A9V6H5_GLOAU